MTDSELTKLLGLNPSVAYLKNLEAQEVIYGYCVESHGMIKVQPTFACEWIEKMPEWDHWEKRTI